MFKKKWLDIPTGYRRLLFLSLLVILLVGVGIIGFMHYESLIFFDALWMTIISVMTIGYGDMYPVTDEGRRFALLIVPFGAGVVTYGLGTAASYLIEKQLSEKVWDKQMDHEIDKLEDHIIVCGFGRVAQQVYRELRDMDGELKVLYIHDNEEELLEVVDQGTLRLIGDPTDRDILEKARTGNARGLIAALDSDADNVFVTLTAKGMNENIEIAARAEKEGSEEVLKRAGADRVINPSSIGGRELAMSVVSPSGIDFINNLMRAEKKEFVVGEVILSDQCVLAGQSVEEANLRREFGITLLAIGREEGVLSNPDPDERFRAGDKLIIAGNEDSITSIDGKVNGTID
ncbi:voltage-gated potassium channel Kch [Bhargavaea cecembensis]|uniref:Voltage-gated potassium channel Kch n=1 Tax=Bhargavaea cecembensis TaxID=394098 RepID=A0A165GLX1_9BACL|nr:potassium channel protein [Bhargavaea cecembensis]KZE36905.1 voltage-gated potassium channel Kch [Bhargavaea cecembensis]